MGRRTALLFLIACLLGLLGAEPTSAQQWARDMFSVTSHDFGVVAKGAKVEFPFTFKNLYVEDVHISGVYTTCTCTTVQYPKEVIKTHQEASVVAVVNTRNFDGRKQATLRGVLDKPFPAEVQLHVYAYIRRDVVLQPGVVEFGSVAQGTAVRKKIDVSYAGRNDWQVTGIECASPYLQTSLAETRRGGGLVSYDLWVTLKEDAPVGYIRDYLILVTNDSNKKAARVPLAVEGVVVSSISVTPSPLPLGVIGVGQSASQRLVVRGQSPFRILSVNCDDPRFKFSVPEGSGKLLLVPVTFTAGDTPGDVAATIRVQLDGQNAKTLAVQAHAQVVATADSQ